MDDPSTGVRGRAGAACWGNSAETPPVEYRFNDCGFRTPQPCHPATANVYRIVMIGSSVGFGLHVSQSDSFAGLLGPKLAQDLQRPVEVYNESMWRGFPAHWATHTGRILQPGPNLILWQLTPYDIVTPLDDRGPVQHAKADSRRHPLNAAKRAWARMMMRLSKSREGVMLQHYFFLSQSQYLAHALQRDSSSVGGSVAYLRAPASKAVERDLAAFAENFHRVAERAKAAKVPLVVTLLPSREQAIMISNHAWPRGYDPDQLGRALRKIVEANGARYADVMAGLASVPDIGNDYLPIDGHPTPAGHRTLAMLLGNSLTHSGALIAAGAQHR